MTVSPYQVANRILLLGIALIWMIGRLRRRLLMIRGSIAAATEILAASGTMFHPSCTCAIGRTDDPMAVVDPECRVYGVAGLRVADASVMPSVPGANTNFPTIMIAERVADFIRAARRSG
jgi:choline dehydrogenase-like flavoprotein